MATEPIAFRPLRRDDFGRLAAWLAEPRVARWWNHDVSPEAIERDFGTSVDGGDATEMSWRSSRRAHRVHPALSDRRLRRVRRGALPRVPRSARRAQHRLPHRRSRRPGSWGGAAMIGAFVAQSWDAYPAAPDVVVPVAAGNHASWRALERGGFVRIAEGPRSPTTRSIHLTTSSTGSATGDLTSRIRPPGVRLRLHRAGWGGRHG